MNMFSIIFSALVAGYLVAGAANSSEIVHMEGTTTLTGFESDGSISVKQESKRFSLWVSECQWAVRLYANTNLPGGITDVACDGTNIYVFVPDASGYSGVGHQKAPFAQSGSVYPSRIKVFPMRMGPIWWAYCSSCVIEGDGPILDFMELTPSRGQTGATVNLRLFEPNKTTSRIGAVEAWIFPANTPVEKADGTPPLAHFRPLSLRETNGFTVVTSSRVTLYYLGIASNQAPQIRCEYLITINDLTFEQGPISAVPLITKAALITDYRTPHRGEYVANRWLDADERGRIFRAPLAAENHPLPDIGLKRIIIIIMLFALTLTGIGFARKLLLRNNKSINN